MTVNTLAIDLRNMRILDNLLAVPPVTLATLKFANSCFKSSSCFINSSFFLPRKSFVFTFDILIRFYCDAQIKIKMKSGFYNANNAAQWLSKGKGSAQCTCFSQYYCHWLIEKACHLGA